jgi:hypothetical protein
MRFFWIFMLSVLTTMITEIICDLNWARAQRGDSCS